MGALSELYAIRHSISADRQVQHQSRSGDEHDSGASMLDFVASVQSAEADIIESEEREERAESKRAFAKLLRTYLKRILTAQEYKFLVECMRGDKTPYKIGLTMGLDYRTVIESIQRKHKATATKLTALMWEVGYDYRHNLDFLPSLVRYVRDNMRNSERMKDYYNNRGGREKKQKYRVAHLEQIRAKDLRYRFAHRDEINARNRAYRNAHREEKNAKNRAYYKAHREELMVRMRSYNATYYEAHRDEVLARQRERYAKNKEEIQAKRRLKKEAQERAEGV